MSTDNAASPADRVRAFVDRWEGVPGNGDVIWRHGAVDGDVELTASDLRALLDPPSDGER